MIQLNGSTSSRRYVFPDTEIDAGCHINKIIQHLTHWWGET
nr:MAG TPA: NAD-dependent protein deacetylase sirtuin-1 [Caudoviricetes sp.]